MSNHLWLIFSGAGVFSLAAILPTNRGAPEQRMRRHDVAMCILATGVVLVLVGIVCLVLGRH